MGEEPQQGVPVRGPLFDPPRAIVPGLPELFGGGLGANAVPVAAPLALPRLELPALQPLVVDAPAAAPWANPIADAASGIDRDAALGALRQGDVRGAFAQLGGSAGEIAAADTPAELAAEVGEALDGVLTDAQRARLGAHRDRLVRRGEDIAARISNTVEGAALVEAVRGDLRDGDWNSTRTAARTATRTAARTAVGTGVKRAGWGCAITLLAIMAIVLIFVVGAGQNL